MRYFLDTEFIEDGHTIDLVSIGIVASDGRSYYAVSSEFDASKASLWVVENVFPHLARPEDRLPRAQIREEILAFVGHDPEFWGYFADYDWVALCQLFGRMIDLPKGWPMYCRDLKQEMDRLGIRRSDLKNPVMDHDALADARWARDVFDDLNRCQEKEPSLGE